jgi:hypothetical protein
MKKLLITLFVIVAVVALLLGGCTGPQEPAAPPGGEEAAPPAEEEAAPPAAVPSYTWEEAKAHIAEIATVTGPVVGIMYWLPPEGVIDVGVVMTGFAVIVPDPTIFPGTLEELFTGKTIAVTGEITTNPFTGGPRIKVTDPSQIVVVE